MSELQDSFVGYYKETKDKVFNYLMYRLNFDRVLAEDLFMDVVLKAYRHFGDFNPQKGSFKTWIFALAHNHLVNYWRDRRRSEGLSLDQLEEQGQSVAVTDSMEAEVSQSIENEKVGRILSMMGEGEREVIVLRYLEGLDYAEISQITSKKEGAIRTGLSRALDRFGSLYKKIYPSEPKAKLKR